MESENPAGNLKTYSIYRSNCDFMFTIKAIETFWKVMKKIYKRSNMEYKTGNNHPRRRALSLELQENYNPLKLAWFVHLAQLASKSRLSIL